MQKLILKIKSFFYTILKKKRLSILTLTTLLSLLLISNFNNTPAIKLPDNIIPINTGVTTSYLIKIPSGYLLFDTGYEKDYEYFLEGIKEKQIEISEVKYLFISHHHDDHVGFINELTARNNELKLIVSEETIPLLKAGKNNTNNGGGIVNRLIFTMFKIKMFLSPDWTLTFPPFTVRESDIIIKRNNSRLPAEVGIQASVIHTSGHTSDGICLMLNNGYILVGDEASNFLNWAGAKNLTLFNESVKEVYQSWEKIIELKNEVILPSHGKPFRSEILKKNLHKYKQNDLVKFF